MASTSAVTALRANTLSAQIFRTLAGAACLWLGLAAPAMAQGNAAPEGNVAGEAATEAAPAEKPEGADEWRHGASLFGDLKYPEGFAAFDYANPDAPKGGTLRQGLVGTFDSFNAYVVKGTPSGAIGYSTETLLKSTLDEPFAEYGLLAEAVKFPADHSSVSFRLNPKARWHDGEPVTAEDVIFSFEMLKEYSPTFRFYYSNVTKAEKTDEREVTFSFDSAGNRELPLIVGQMPVFAKHWYENEDGSVKREFNASTLEPTLGSGPYKISAYEPGRFVEVSRVDDYWGKDLPVNRGWYNFDRIRTEYFLDITALVEAFKAGILDFRAENSAKRWATEYNFPAVQRGDVVLEEFDFETVEPFQGYVFNLRLPKFQDPRVRYAFNLAYDFEWLNNNIFFNQYARTDSYFEGSELEATGVPTGIELAMLEPLRGQIPEEVFTKDFENPKAEGPRGLRQNLRQAQQLLKEAGYEVRGGKLTNVETGEVFTVEFLYDDANTERTLLPYREALQQLGFVVSLRRVDAAQYQNRVQNFNFEVITALMPQSLSPGNEQREWWGSEAADRMGSRNYAGIKNPAVDALINEIIFSDRREELVAATHALDRVLLWNYYHVPQMNAPVDRTARWNVFGMPEPLPPYASIAAATLDLWWFDADKAAKVRRN